MTTTPEYAALSLYVYASTPINKIELPPGWELAEPLHPDGGLGFSYGVFRRIGTTEVVVAYAGTNQGIDWVANVKNGIGLSSTQTTEAALAYLTAKQQYGSNITLTGHSLGGGLASVMAVWFDRPAVVFDEAPFEMTARSPWVIPATKVALALAGFSDDAFTGYTGLLDFYARESQVTNYYLEGEALAALRVAFPTVMGADYPVRANSADMAGVGGAIDLHSQALLTAMLLSPAFQQSTYASTRILPLLIDKNFYAYDAKTSDQQNVLINFIRSEQGPGDKLTHFAADLQKLGTNIEGLNKAAQDALIAQGIEWYYWQGTDYAGQEFFTRTGESLQYTIAMGDGLVNAQNKAASYVGKWLAPIVKDHGEFYSTGFATHDQWNVITGGSGASLTALAASKSQIFIGGTGGDTFTGGDLGDVMFAGAGNDTLNGGGGNDELYGGAGNDTLRGGAGHDRYVIEGHDTIEDSDGIGSIRNKAGQRIAGAVEKRGDGSYVFLSDTTITVAGGADLTLTLADGSGVTIKNFQSGDLGLHLNDTATTPEISRTILGDLAPLDFDPITDGVQTRVDDLGNVITDPNRPQPGRADYLYDSAGNDDIRGYGGEDYINAWRGGNDRLDGGAGNDIVLGRAGDDIIIGGEGMDLLRGDAGRDRLYAGTEVTLEAALAAQDAAASGLKGDFVDGSEGDDVVVGDTGHDALNGGQGDDILLGGAGDDTIRGDLKTTRVFMDWSISRSVTTDENGVTSYLATYNNVSFNEPTDGGDDVIFAGAGVDWVHGEYGDDYIDGGADDDVLFGGENSDDIFGGTGNDILVGDDNSAPLSAQGEDYLDGEEGDDEVWGNGGNDQIFGGIGNDNLYGGAGNDYLDGEDGDDMLIGDAGADILFGGAGADYLQGDAGDKVGDGDDYLDGGAGDDILLGLGGRDEIHGGDGADRIAGDNGGYDTSGAADTIYGGAGNDFIDGQGGDDIIDAGADNDLVVGGAGDDLIFGGTGNDQLQGGEGNDTLDGGEGGDVLFGQAGNDSLRGGAGTDYLLGGLGDDVLDGGEGNDVYYYTSGEGNDRISDSGGTDWLVFTDINWGQVQLGVGSMKLTIPGGEIHLDDFDPDNPYAAGGIEYFQFADGTVMSKAQLINAIGFTPTGTPEADVLSGTALPDTIRALAGDDVVTARGGNDMVYADDGADVVYAGEGNDIVYGGMGDDVLLGEAGDDMLYGEAGNDLLAGGAGADQLMGGDGDDAYLFQTGDGQDTVTDALGQNLIALGAGLTLDAVTFGRQGNDLFVAIKNTTDRLTVKDWFAADSHFSSVMLGDGSVLDRAGVEAAMPTNQAPLASADSVTVVEDGLVTASGNALANDSDPEGRALRVTNPGSYAGAYGSLSLQADGSYSYGLDNGSTAIQRLAAGQSLTEQYAYTVTDDDPNGAATAESAIVVTVLGSNDLPVLGTDNAATAEDASPISGNVLANDHDIDAGTTLMVANAGGTRTGSYGALELGGDGAWRYSLANGSSAVQSLAAGQTVTERFDFNVSDGTAQVGGALSIAVAGQNDAPILVTALADQSAAANTNWSWQLPAGSFADVDAGDVLRYGATLADGTALPSWLSFDAATQTFSGRVPKSATGSVDIRVGATDRLGANAADVFTLNFAAGTGGGGGGNGGGTGNEGVGNGVDGPPPGHDTSFNDGTGTNPGNPGAEGGNGYRPPRREDIVLTHAEIAGPMREAPAPIAAHGSSATAHSAARGQVNKAADDHFSDTSTASPYFDTVNGANARDDRAAAMIHPDATGGRNEPAQRRWLTDAAWADLAGEAWGASGHAGSDDTTVFARWLAVRQAMAREAANAGTLPAWLDAANGADLRGLLVVNGGLAGAYQTVGVDTIGLPVGAGLQVFKGLGQGAQKIA